MLSRLRALVYFLKVFILINLFSGHQSYRDWTYILVIYKQSGLAPLLTAIPLEVFSNSSFQPGCSECVISGKSSHEWGLQGTPLWYNWEDSMGKCLAGASEGLTSLLSQALTIVCCPLVTSSPYGGTEAHNMVPCILRAARPTARRSWMRGK